MKVVVPPRLNEQQHQYLLAAYRTDQQVEGERRRGCLRGRWEHWAGRPPTPLREQLAEFGDALISEGTGSTWRALAQRGLLEVEDQMPYLVAALPAVMHYILPHIRLTWRPPVGPVTGGEVLAKKSGKVLAQLWGTRGRLHTAAARLSGGWNGALPFAGCSGRQIMNGW